MKALSLPTPRGRRIDLGSVLIHAILILLAVLILLPFYWMAVASSLTVSQIVTYPPHLLPGNHFIANFQELLKSLPFARAFLNTLFLATLSTSLHLFLASLAGYAFAKYDFPARDQLFVIMLATMMVPAAVGLVPWYIMMSRFGWVDSYKALIIPGMVGAFGIFWMRMVITDAVPDEMIQAARIDGCTDFGIYARIVVPVILPGLGALGIMTFMNAWNDYMAPLIILRTLEKYTLAVMLALLNDQYSRTVHLVMMGSTIATVPVLVVFFMASKRFIKGLTAGAVKG